MSMWDPTLPKIAGTKQSCAISIAKEFLADGEIDVPMHMGKNNLDHDSLSKWYILYFQESILIIHQFKFYNYAILNTDSNTGHNKF